MLFSSLFSRGAAGRGFSRVRRAAVAALLLLGISLPGRAQNTVFNDAFSADQLNPATYPAVTPTATGWCVLSSKNAPAPTLSDSVLSINMVATTSGFIETQARFASTPVQLLPSTYIELVATFVPTAINVVTSDNLIFGLFNSGGSGPLSTLSSSGLSSTLSNAASGGAKGWIGYNGNIPYSGSPSMRTRAAQTGTNNTVQDVVIGGQSSSTGYTTPAAVNASSVGTMSAVLTNGNTYTVSYKLALNAAGTAITATVTLFNGAGTSGSGSNTQVGTYSGTFSGTSLLTTAFDALAIGWRTNGNAVGSLQLSTLTVKTTGGAPWFTTQPAANVSASAGSSVTLTAVAGGSVTAYQWQVSHDGGDTFANISSATNASAATATLSLDNVSSGDAGLYRLVATNSAGSTASSASTVAVTSADVAPSINTAPVGGTINSGSSYTFSVVANGTTPLSYQWQFSADNTTFENLAGATGATCTIASAPPSAEGYYRVIVTNVAGTATSSAALLSVNEILAITAQPVGATINAGASFTLSVTATGKPTPNFQWYLNGAAIPGATGSSYAITNAAGAQAGLYTVVVSNTAGDSVTSSAAAVAVVSPSFAAASFTPSAGATGQLADTRLAITFNQPVSLGASGTIKIFDASNNALVDTIDLVAANALMKTLRAGSTLSTQALPVQVKTIGGVSNFNYYPITLAGNTATIYPRNGVLAFNKSYYVTIDPGVFVDSTGLSYAGIATNSGWSFATKTTAPSSTLTVLTVAADGSGDFCTVQAALDFIANNNTTPRTIYLRNGTYFETVYFASKHNLTILGEDIDRTVIAYPNNNTFNPVGGVYHRAVFNANSVHDCTFANLTIRNTTPQNGSQAEALIVSGTSATVAKNIVTRCKFYSYQDTVQFNKQTYVSDCTIWGDVDFLWGDGPVFLENCDLRILRTGGYLTQIRNGSGNHGYVFVNCRFTAPAGITGAFLGRIDPASFPYSEVVVLDSTFGDDTNNAFLATNTGVSGANYAAGWWLLNNAASAATATNVHNWTGNLLDGNGAPLTNPNPDAFTAMPTDATTLANYRNAAWVLNTSLAGAVNGTWTPALAPIIVTQPASHTADIGDATTFSVAAVGVPEPTYQWFKNGTAIGGATDATYTIAHVAAADADTYYVVVSNPAGTITSNTVTLVVHGAPPVITQQPVSQAAFAGFTLGLSVGVTGNGPFTYQWSKGGAPLDGATSSTLVLTNFSSADAGSYAVAVSNDYGTTTSSAATLSLATAAADNPPTLPTLPTTVFNVADYGAIGDSVTDNTAAIAAAVTAAKNAGGGIVLFPPASGAYLSGPITLGSNLNLHLAGGATLRMLPYGTYTPATTHFITFPSGSSNFALTGSGTIDGQGADWWTAYKNGLISTRPRLVQFTRASNVLVQGITLLNSPNFNLAFSSPNTNVTIHGVTILAPGDSPNTDGMDLAGTNFLVQNCAVSVGDDNVVAKPGSAFCANIVVTDCTFGAGHGVSIGGQTNVGLDGMLVKNCTFNGTSTALRLKADSTQGGPVQNVTFENITMTNVTYPILFYSYYNQIGSPGATSGSSQTTSTKVNQWNATPPNSLALSTIPTWKNITVRNLTVTNGSGYSMIWGLPTADALIQNVTLENVNIQGGAGLELYDAANIQLVGSNNVGPILTCNALAITAQPANQTVTAGGTATFSATAVGGSGTSDAGLTYQWKRNGAALVNGTQADGSVVSGATSATLTITNARAASGGSFTLTAATTLDGYNTSTSTLVANSLPVSATSRAATLTVNPASATVTLSALTATYDGTPKTPTVTTNPTGLNVAITYNGSSTAPSAIGSYAVVATIIDANYTGSASGTFTIDASPYARWAAAAGLTGSNGAPTDDPDGDGLNNFLEYALGSNPTSATSANLPGGAIEGGNFVFRFTRPLSVTDVTYAVQKSADLTTWTTVATTVESSTATTETRIASVAATQPKEFFRLRVDDCATVPVGYMNFTLPNGATLAFGIPLDDPAGPASGIKGGRVAAFTATTLTHASGGWTADVLGAEAAPWAVRFTSGSAAGKLVDIGGNTATTLTLRNVDLTTLGVAVGDTFELVALDTLGTLFGSTVLQGGTSTINADNVQIRSGGTAITYFYDTTLNYWRRSTTTVNANDATLRPGSGSALLRRGATKTFTVTGRVLGTTYRQPVANAGATTLTHGFPTDTTLGALAFQTRLNGWRAGTSTAADQLYLHNGTTWIGYVYNGTNWIALTGGAVSNSVPVPAGALLLIQRPGATSGTTDFVYPLPY